MPQDLSIIYIDINAAFLNPTRNLLLPALRGSGRVRCFGPGFVDSKTLRGGLASFIAAIDGAGVVVANSHTIFADIYEMALITHMFKRNYALDFPADDVVELARIAREFERLAELGIPRVVILLENDYYNWRPREIEALQRRADYVIAFGPEFWRHKAELPNLGKETFAKQATDAWADWVHANAERVASQLHFVSDSEFRWARLAHRQRDWGMPGIRYWARREARRRLEAAGIRPVGESPLRRGMGALKKLGLMRREPRWLQHHLNADHQDRLGAVRFAYTCGSGLNMPVRKFFEIPAAGAVLVCQPFNGFEAAGFRHGENAFVSAPETVVDAHKVLRGDLDYAQRLADAGQRLVFERHSIAARAAQFRETLQAMADRSFAGARWVDGRYRVIRRTA